MDPVTLRLSKNYTDEKSQESGLKVTEIGKELSTLKNTLSQINPNHEAKQVSSGYGVVSLPKTATSGIAGAKLHGQTLKNETNYNPETWAGWTKTSGITIENGTLIFDLSISPLYISLGANFKPGTKYLIILDVAENGSTAGSIQLQDYLTGVYNSMIAVGNIGYVKRIITTQASITNNTFRLTRSGASAGTTVTINKIWAYELPAGSQIEVDANNLTADELALKYPYIQGGEYRSVPCAGRFRGVDANGNTESNQYFIATEEDGSIAEARSLPNGVRDSLDRKRIEKVVIDSNLINNNTVNYQTITSNWIGFRLDTKSGIPLPFGDWAIDDSTSPFYNNKLLAYNLGNLLKMAGHNYFISTNEPFLSNTDNLCGFEETNAFLYIKLMHSLTGLNSTSTINDIKAWLDTNPITLYYQLATEQIRPIQTSGTLLSQPSGTVYCEPIIPDVGIYNNGISVLHQDLPIKSIEKLSKIDFSTGIETELDTSLVVIASDRLSFTHPNLTDGDITSFIYEYDVSTPIGQTDVEFYDSRYVIEDSAVPGKFYQWEIQANNGVANIALVEV